MRMTELLCLPRRRDRDCTRTGREGGLHTLGGVFDDHAVRCLQPELRDCGQKHFRVRFAMSHAIARRKGLKELTDLEEIENQIDVEAGRR